MIGIDADIGKPPPLFGWDWQTWKRAFLWAGVEPIRASDASKLTPEQFGTFIRVKEKWLESGGPLDGPKGSIIL